MEIFFTPDCDSPESNGDKFKALATCPEDFFEGSLAEALDDAAPHIGLSTADIERLNKRVRDANPIQSVRKRLIENICAKEGIQQWTHAHKLIGGSLPTGLTGLPWRNTE